MVLKSQNKKNYIQEYNKEHYKTFKVDLKKEELQELNELLKKEGLTKAQFLRDAIIALKFQAEVDRAFERKVKEAHKARG